MKIKNLFVLTSLILLGTLFSGFVRPSVDITTEEKGGESFAEFLSHFNKTTLPFEIGIDDLKGYENFRKEKKEISTLQKKKELPNENQKIKWEQKTPARPMSKIQDSKYLPESRIGKFSRGGSPTLNPVARFYPNEKTVAVIYTSRRSFSSPLFESYRMVVYDLKGNIIQPKKKKFIKKKKSKDSHPNYFFGGAFDIAEGSTIETTTSRIDKKGRIWLNTYENIWKDDTRKVGFENNQLIDFKLKTTEVFQIGKDGLAVKLNEVPTDARASLD